MTGGQMSPEVARELYPRAVKQAQWQTIGAYAAIAVIAVFMALVWFMPDKSVGYKSFRTAAWLAFAIIPIKRSRITSARWRRLREARPEEAEVGDL